MSLLDRAARFIDDVLLLPEDVRLRMDEAERLLERDEPERAEALLREVLEERPSLFRARHALALALESRGALGEARRVVAVTRGLDPDEARAALLASRLALADGDLDAAVEEAREAALRLASSGGPDFAAACVLRARAERARGRPDRAARELRKALSVGADEGELRLELAESLAEAGRLGPAAIAARGVDISALDDASAARLGWLWLRLGEPRRARPLLMRGLAGVAPRAELGLARAHLGLGEPAEAEPWARKAVAAGLGIEALLTLAEALAGMGQAAAAADASLSAAELALAAGEGERARALARRVAETVPLDSPALPELISRARALAPEDAAVAALAAWSGQDVGPLDLEATPRARLVAARAALEAGEPTLALEHLGGERPFAPVDRSRAAALRRKALEALWRGAAGEVDLAAAIDEVARFARERGLAEVERRALGLRDELDRPLLLAILGEFNAGKSTLVNAFVGADVAPTGIVPTTATLNLLRGGAERRARVVRRDGTTREGTWDSLRSLLAEADASEGEERIASGGGVDHVEIVLPNELLERVWILDTPGSNAPVAEHEALAREAMRRADAALWVFDAAQAGKATEGRILDAVRASRRHVVAALNKVDRLSPEDLETVRASLSRELPGVGERAVPLSARRALRARLADDEEAFAASGFPALVERLEEDVFGRARALKRRACGGRLIALLDDALGAEEEERSLSEARASALGAAEGALGAAAASLGRAADAACRAVATQQRRALREVAEEVLAFVRPRESRFSRHGAHPEDRAFLAEVLERRLGEVLHDAEAEVRRVALEAIHEVGPALGWDETVAERRVDAALGPPFARLAGFQAGMWAGGALRRFFEESLPHAELEVVTLAEALELGLASPKERLEPALLEAIDDLVAGLEAERRQARDDLTRRKQAVLAGTFEPLRALKDVLEELVDSAP